MKKQLQGIALILFGILLSADLPFGFLGVIIGIVGLPPTKRGNPPLRNKYSKNS